MYCPNCGVNQENDICECSCGYKSSTKKSFNIDGIKVFLKLRQFIVLVVALVFILPLAAWITRDACSFFINPTYVIKQDKSTGSLDTVLHKKDCQLVKGNSDLKGVTGYGIEGGYLNGQYTLCPVCHPEKPSLKGMKLYMLDCEQELKGLEPYIDDDNDVLDKKQKALDTTDKAKTDYEKQLHDELYSYHSNMGLNNHTFSFASFYALGSISQPRGMGRPIPDNKPSLSDQIQNSSKELQDYIKSMPINRIPDTTQSIQNPKRTTNQTYSITQEELDKIKRRNDPDIDKQKANGYANAYYQNQLSTFGITQDQINTAYNRDLRRKELTKTISKLMEYLSSHKNIFIF